MMSTEPQLEERWFDCLLEETQGHGPAPDLERRVVSSPDLLADPDFDVSREIRAAVTAEGIRASLSAPLLSAAVPSTPWSPPASTGPLPALACLDSSPSLPDGGRPPFVLRCAAASGAASIANEASAGDSVPTLAEASGGAATV